MLGAEFGGKTLKIQRFQRQEALNVGAACVGLSLQSRSSSTC